MRKEITLAEIIHESGISDLRGGEAGILCIECKKLHEEKDMKKIFERGEGICKGCWNFDDSEE